MVTVECPHCQQQWQARRVPIRCSMPGCKKRLPTGNPTGRPPLASHPDHMKKEVDKRKTIISARKTAPSNYGQRHDADGKPLFSEKEMALANFFKRAPRVGF